MSRGARTALALGVVLVVVLVTFVLWQGGRGASETGAPGSAVEADAGSGSGAVSASEAVSGATFEAATGTATGTGTGSGSEPAQSAGSGPDGGIGGATVSAAPPAPEPPPALHSSEIPPPRPVVRLDHPPTPEENLERAGRVHDYVVLRRHDVRRRIAELEGSGESAELGRLRRELAGLEAAERDARERVERYAGEVGQPAGEVGQPAGEVGQPAPAE